MSKKKTDPPKCRKCEKILKWPKWTGQKSLPVELDGSKHICGVQPTELEEDDIGIITNCPNCHQQVLLVDKKYYDDSDCVIPHSCGVSESKEKAEENVKFQPADKITKGYPGLKVTKIKLERTDNQWGSLTDKKSDMDYGTGEAKTKADGKGKTITSGFEISTEMVEPIHLENAMTDMAILLRKHNQKELEQ